MEANLDVAWASQVFKFLTSKDPKVVMMGARCLRDTVTAKTAVNEANIDEVLKFLNSPMDEGKYHRSTNVRSLFSLVRGCFHHLWAELFTDDGGAVRLRI